MGDREMRDVPERDPMLALRDDPVLRTVVSSLREMPPSDPEAVRRIVRAAVAAGPQRASLARPWHIAGAAVAASVLVAAGYIVGHRPNAGERDRVSTGWSTVAQPASRVAHGVAATAFRLDAPAARAVSLVGDFNSWDPAATPMTRDADGRGWSVAVTMPAGRHTYAFVVDGLVIADPDVPSVRDPDYDVAVSALIVRER